MTSLRPVSLLIGSYFALQLSFGVFLAIFPVPQRALVLWKSFAELRRQPGGRPRRVFGRAMSPGGRRVVHCQNIDKGGHHEQSP